MIIIHVMGGLGNQLYQYAMYEKLKSLGKQVKLDLDAYQTDDPEAREWRSLELEWLDGLSYDVCTKEERTLFLDNSMKLLDRIRRKVTGRKSRKVEENKSFMPEIYQMDDVYLYGYWACEKYYEEIIPLLQEKIHFKTSSNPKNQQCIEQMKQENAVSIHVRRQDYLTVADGKRYMGICTDAYYQTAIAFIKQHVVNPIFYVFSDDAAYAREHFNEPNMHIVDWNKAKDSLYDMQLMSNCKHHICANSTFSMWGARLNPYKEKIMIRPLHADNYEKTSVTEMHEMWKQWILITPEGKLV